MQVQYQVVFLFSYVSTIEASALCRTWTHRKALYCQMTKNILATIRWRFCIWKIEIEINKLAEYEGQPRPLSINQHQRGDRNSAVLQNLNLSTTMMLNELRALYWRFLKIRDTALCLERFATLGFLTLFQCECFQILTYFYYCRLSFGMYGTDNMTRWKKCGF